MRTTSRFFLAGLFIAGTFGSAVAQTPPQRQPSPEEMQKLMESSMNSMVPMMARLSEVLIEAQLAAAERGSTAERVAAFKRNLYEALMRRGFTAEQALQITIATQPPAAAPTSR